MASVTLVGTEIVRGDAALEIAVDLGATVPEGLTERDEAILMLADGEGGPEPTLVVVKAAEPEKASAPASAVPAPKKGGLSPDDVKFLVGSVRSGKTYPEARAALLAKWQPHLHPSDAAFVGWEAEVVRRAAEEPAFYPEHATIPYRAS